MVFDPCGDCKAAVSAPNSATIDADRHLASALLRVKLQTITTESTLMFLERKRSGVIPATIEMRQKNGENAFQTRPIVVTIRQGNGLNTVGAGMFGKGILAGAVLAGVMAFSGGASAAVIDFTSASTGHTGSILGGSVTWTMTASGVLNNSQAFDGNTAPSGTGLSFQTDGYGVGRNDDEITTNPNKPQEWIDVTFSAPVLINAIYFLDLFRASNGSSFEVGQATIDGTTVISLAATDIASSGAPGFASSVFAPIYATVIRFTVLKSNDGLGFADGALAGIGIAPVPVPAAGLMLLGGLGGIAAVRRRRKA